MRFLRSGIVAVAAVLVCASDTDAQRLEVTPFGGYRFGGDFFELLTGQPVDADGAPALGVAVNVPLFHDVQFEGLFTRQRADVTTLQPLGQLQRWRIAVDHWQAGGLRELGGDRVRPFLTGTVGLTRFALEGDDEWRLGVGAGGGAKLFLVPHLGVRLDGRVFATFVDADARAIACSVSPCFVSLDLDVIWQAEFTAGLVIAFR
jgi:hypothetical protein